MKVLLIKDVNSLGKAGEIKDVKDGYGKNFLIGKGFAKLATDEVVAEWKEQQRLAQEALDAEIAKLNDYKKEIEDITLIIKHKAGANGHMIGSITKDEIADELKKQYKIEIDKKGINQKKAIKTFGLIEVDLKLGHAIHAKLKIDIVSEA
jgi:large subunit ribosomal protein L9